MSFSKKHWLFHLLALIAIVVLASARCGHDNTTGKKPPKTQNAPHNCPPDNSCQDGYCATHPADNDAGGNQEKKVSETKAEADAGAEQNSSRRCETAKDCGCGYKCVDNICRKLDSACCGNADCKAGEFCSDHDDSLVGMCKPWECDDDDQCSKCGTICANHLCAQDWCCVDTDCPTGEVCYFFNNESDKGYCAVPKCTSDTDCGCDQACSDTMHFCTEYSDHPIPCCNGKFYYDRSRSCELNKHIENGNCLDDRHCPVGNVCKWRKCLPTTCAENADCGCEAVCRKGHCETGCDSNSDCCTEGDICDRGECIDPNAEEEEDE